MLKIFRVLNFQNLWWVRKIFNNKNFPNYGMCICSPQDLRNATSYCHTTFTPINFLFKGAAEIACIFERHGYSHTAFNKYIQFWWWTLFWMGWAQLRCIIPTSYASLQLLLRTASRERTSYLARESLVIQHASGKYSMTYRALLTHYTVSKCNYFL